MSCCAPGAELYLDQVRAAQDEIALASRPVHDGLRQTDLSVPDIRCGACLHQIEGTLGKLDGVASARANLSAKRVTVLWRGDTPPPLMPALQAIGYRAHLHDIAADSKDPVMGELLRALAVAGFASSNIMLLSVSVWAGAEAATRDLFHWISALIALPTLVYSGRVFFLSAWQSLRHGRTNMDVPISIGVLLTFGMSLYETIHHGPYAYFDAAVSLLFFLLIGRTLDHVMRERARPADRPDAGPCHARAGTQGRRRTGALIAARCTRPAARRHPDLSAGRRDRAGDDHPARRRGESPRRRARRQG